MYHISDRSLHQVTDGPTYSIPKIQTSSFFLPRCQAKLANMAITTTTRHRWQIMRLSMLPLLCTTTTGLLFIQGRLQSPLFHQARHPDLPQTRIDTWTRKAKTTKIQILTRNLASITSQRSCASRIHLQRFGSWK